MIRFGALVIILCSVIHCAWGFAVLTAPYKTTGVDLILTLAGNHNIVAGLIFILAGLLAMISIRGTFNKTMIHVMLLMPQQTILFISMIGAIQCIVLGRFADGVVRPWPFIFVDQIYLVMLCLFHVVAIITGYGLRKCVRFV